MVKTAPANQNSKVMPTLSVPLMTVVGELKIPVPRATSQCKIYSWKRLAHQPITRFTTSPITVQVPSLNRSSGALVMIVFGMFSGKISKTASLILLSSSAVRVGTFVRDCEAVVRDAMVLGVFCAMSLTQTQQRRRLS